MYLVELITIDQYVNYLIFDIFELHISKNTCLRVSVNHLATKSESLAGKF